MNTAQALLAKSGTIGLTAVVERDALPAQWEGVRDWQVFTSKVGEVTKMVEVLAKAHGVEVAFDADPQGNVRFGFAGANRAFLETINRIEGQYDWSSI